MLFLSYINVFSHREEIIKTHLELFINSLFVKVSYLGLFVDAGKGCRRPECHRPCNVTKETTGANKVTVGLPWSSMNYISMNLTSEEYPAI